jgi:hypothetical protein
MIDIQIVGPLILEAGAQAKIFNECAKIIFTGLQTTRNPHFPAAKFARSDGGVPALHS